MEIRERIIVALDVDSLDKAKILVESLAPHVGCFKVGLELLTAVGAPQVVEFVHSLGGQVFYDGKFMDIPNTVAGASQAVTKLGVDMFNVHCLGGRAMMEAARKVVDEAVTSWPAKPFILGVTILTSLDYPALVEMGIFDELNIADPDECKDIQRDRMESLIIRHLAWLAKESRLDGVISSPQEIVPIREYLGNDFMIVTPGVRPAWAAANDQKRVMTPGEAIKAGADFLVIGRPITKPPVEIGTPADAAQKIAEEIASAS
jgi:orotidine-5'-phosphate decarboxylase